MLQIHLMFLQILFEYLVFQVSHSLFGFSKPPYLIPLGALHLILIGDLQIQQLILHRVHFLSKFGILKFQNIIFLFGLSEFIIIWLQLRFDFVVLVIEYAFEFFQYVPLLIVVHVIVFLLLDQLRDEASKFF